MAVRLADLLGQGDANAAVAEGLAALHLLTEAAVVDRRAAAGAPQRSSRLRRDAHCPVVAQLPLEEGVGASATALIGAPSPIVHQ